jgi:hypothetical protein
MAGAAGSGGRFRNKPNAMGLSEYEYEEGMVSWRREVVVNDYHTDGNLPYHNT